MKLSLDALKERAEATGNEELMETISGGTANACHKETSAWYDFALSIGTALFNTGFGR